MLREIKNRHTHYFVDEQNCKQGKSNTWWGNGELQEKAFYIDGKIYNEYKLFHDNGEIFKHCFYYGNVLHGECKINNLELSRHCFYVNGKIVSFDEIPYPETEEDRMYFKLKYDIPLLPVENKC